uniref:Phosphoenolpyruvate synthase n=1 Tax=Fundidesulfovibrio putealis TaxID=270496 RepID=A0A7C4EJ89_9BACT
MPFLRSVTSQAVFHSLRMVRGYENLSGHAMPVLRQCIEGLAERFKEILSARAVEQDVPWFLDFSQISRNDGDHVGGKCANLGETRNRAMLPVPDGFAITTSAFNAFLEKSGLRDEIAKLAMTLDPQDPGSIQQASEDIQRMMLLAPLPESFAEELLERHAALAGNMGRDPGAIRVALRSSAIGEDGELSFAGQYLSVLGVTREKLVESYRYVAASLYPPGPSPTACSRAFRTRPRPWPWPASPWWSPGPAGCSTPATPSTPRTGTSWSTRCGDSAPTRWTAWWTPAATCFARPTWRSFPAMWPVRPFGWSCPPPGGWRAPMWSRRTWARPV